MQSLFRHPIILDGVVYIASDFHLGSPTAQASKERENHILRWLDHISKDASHLILLGDIFDFWFEYKDVVPRGYYNFLSKLDALSRKGIEIYYFTGNHDMWVKDYFSDEFKMKLFRSQQPFLINGKRCMIGHGDGLGPKDRGYKFIKWLFARPLNIRLFGALHPRIAFGIARFFSRKSRSMTSRAEEAYMGDQKEYLVQYCREVSLAEQLDYFIYGHRHLPIEKTLDNGSIYLNTGDWITHYTFLRMSKEKVELSSFSK